VTNTRDAEWAEAKRLCRLSADDVRMAKQLGLRPRSLIKNIPSPAQRWKAPVREWVRELYRKRHTGTGRPEPRRDVPYRVAPPPDDRGAWDAADSGEPGEAEPRDRRRTSLEKVEEENARLLGRQRELRLAADYVAAAFARRDEVERVVLFGSVASPLRKEVPRFRRFRRAGIELWHECKDVDLAVWVSDCGSLHALTKARGRALNDLFAKHEIGVAHHQVDVFILEPATDRYLGRLCTFGFCPKGKPECRVPGCGQALFLRQHEDFVFDPAGIGADRSVDLFARGRLPPPTLRRRADEDEIPF
jgi:hypothetical protein